MARVISTNVQDIMTGFNISLDEDMYTSTRDAVRSALEQIGEDPDIIPESEYKIMAQESLNQAIPQCNDLVNKAEEIFLSEASLSKWSGNMVDNSVVAVAGTMPKAVGNRLVIDLRIGVSKKAISTGNGRWRQRRVYKKDWRNPSRRLYEYNGYRMRPGVDYSQFLEAGTARIPNAAAWAGFVERAEDRFNAL